MEQSTEPPLSVLSPCRVMSYTVPKDAAIGHVLRQCPSTGQGG